MTVHADPVSSVLDRIKRTLVGLRMPRALEMIDTTIRQLERGEISPLEAIEGLLAEELSLRENRRVKTALVMARLSTIKTLASFDFAFQPSLDRNRVLALAQLDFIDRHEVVHLLGPPASRTSRSRSGSRRSRPAAASTSSLSPTSSARWPRRSAKVGCATRSASSAAPRS
jgi:IstB-like ATP binding protein